jgi:protein gp37
MTSAVKFISVEPILDDLGELDLTGVDWVIAGGESGPGARPMQADWVQMIRDRCLERHMTFLFKQWGVQPAYYRPAGGR